MFKGDTYLIDIEWKLLISKVSANETFSYLLNLFFQSVLNE